MSRDNSKIKPRRDQRIVPGKRGTDLQTRFGTVSLFQPRSPDSTSKRHKKKNNRCITAVIKQTHFDGREFKRYVSIPDVSNIWPKLSVEWKESEG